MKDEALKLAQEPVAHLWECLGRWSAYLVQNGKQANCAPPSWLVAAINKATTPPQRTWVGLTDAQAERLYRNISPTQQQDVKSLAAFKRLLRVIEAAHGIKEKNNGT